MTRRPWQRIKGWSPEEAAAELHSRRELLAIELRRRPTARGIPFPALEEVVNDAITAVVMDNRPIHDQQHLLGAFWIAADFRLRRHHEGRHLTRLGSRRRIDLDSDIEQTPAAYGVEEQVELIERTRRATDWLADLDERERLVVSVMASRGIGPLLASRLLGLPLGDVRSAARSATAKLDRVAVIAAAGRMCDYRYKAIEADAAGHANDHQARAAQAHLAACSSCQVVYRGLRREMSRDWQRRASAALTPLPLTSTAHARLLGKLAHWFSQRPSLPRLGSERTAELAGGAGIIKAAAAGTAIVAATASIAGGLHTLTDNPHHTHHTHPRVDRIAPAASTQVLAAAATSTPTSVTPFSQPASQKTSSNHPTHSNSHGTPQTKAQREFGIEGTEGSSSHSTPTASTASVTHAPMAHQADTASGTASESMPP